MPHATALPPLWENTVLLGEIRALRRLMRSCSPRANSRSASWSPAVRGFGHGLFLPGQGADWDQPTLAERLPVKGDF